ncbi:MAG: DNA polymerase I [bacterium]
MSNSGKEIFMIIDGNALIHRSFHALPISMATKNGETINAVYGFTAVLLKALREFKPEFVVLTLDRKEPTFRHEKFKDYKATRVKAPDELYAQIPRVKEIAGAFNIPIFEMAGFEADDLIGTLAEKIGSKAEKIIVTGDMDTMQLINEHTKVFTMKRGLTDAMIYDEKAVRERYGLEPCQMIDFKALRGDPSDNIPGVKGIGEKTATELLRNFKTLDGVYENLDSEKIKPRISELLKSYRSDAFMSKELGAIKCDVDIDFDIEKARFGRFDIEKVAKLLNELEFYSLLPRLQSLGAEDEKRSGESRNWHVDKFKRNLELFKYELIDDNEKFDNFFEKLRERTEFAFDTETGNFDPVSADLLGISFSWKTGEAYYLEIKNQKSKIKNNLFDYNNEKNDRNAEWLEKLRPVFENVAIKKYGHNIKYDIEVMASLGIKVKGVAADSMIASYLLNPGSRQHNLDAVTFSEFGHQKISKEDLLGKGKEKINFGAVPIEKLYNYSCEDSDFSFRLVKKLLPRLAEQKLEKLFNEIEMPLALALVDMEMNGIKINTEFLRNIGKKTDEKIKRLKKKIYESAGLEFNINSTQQLREVLFEKLGIPAAGVSKNKTGLSTGADELAKLKGRHPIIQLIQEYREIVKLSTTYIHALPKLVNPKTGRLHTSFNQTVTATGRLSSTEPNMQNIPVRAELGREIRKSFISGDDYELLSLDYSQIELRIAAHMSGDKKMIAAFKKGEDIHTATAAEINQVELKNVTAEMRREAKSVNFGILYGQGPHGLSAGADIPYARAKEFIDKYFTVYEGVKKFIDRSIELARESGCAETLFGRRRFLPEINSSVLQVRKAAERMAVNTPIQGTAADIIKIAMIGIREMINEKYKSGEVKMLLQVHDELVFEVKKDSAARISAEIKDIMENAIKLEVPLLVDASAGNNWGEME